MLAGPCTVTDTARALTVRVESYGDSLQADQQYLARWTYLTVCTRGVRRIFGGGVPRGGGGGVPRSAKEANNPILLKVQSLQLSFRPAGVSLGGGGGGPRPPLAPPLRTPLCTYV